MRRRIHRLALFALVCAGCGGVAGRDGNRGVKAVPHDYGPPSGTIDPNGGGGTVNVLSFTAFGDVRPALPDEDFAYPTDVITSIMKGMDGIHPEFAVGTGDYMFVEFFDWAAEGQLGRLQDAESNFNAPIFHALGNHECQSFENVNCPNLDESINIQSFMSTLLPWSQVPYYSFVVHTALGDAKLVFIAVNAWTDAQAAWLDQTLAQPTAYTFVIRHQPTPDAGKAASAAGIAASDAILAKYPVTLYLFGHVHEYKHLTANRVVTGNSGAPLDGGNNYGFLNVLQRNDGNIAVTAYDQATGNPVDTWAVTPAGDATN